MQINNDEILTLLEALCFFRHALNEECELDRVKEVNELIEKVSNESTPGTGRIGSPAEVDGNERMGDGKDTGR